MRKLLISTALCSAILATPAQAIPVAYIASVISGTLGVSFSATFAALSGVASLAGSLVLSAAGQRLFGRRPGAQEIKRELAQPQSRPPKRFVYGRYRAMGSPARPVETNNVLYMAYVLNSRPSAGNMTVFFDDRKSKVVAGDMFDFSGPGATLEPDDEAQSFGVGADRPRVWIGLGNQTTIPAEILAGADGEFLGSDVGRGLTIIWVRIPRGENSTWFDRWPSWPPLVEAEGNYSLVWDPRDEAQDPDSPETWAWSDNQALCLLDSILRNPIIRRPRFLVDIEAFSDAADLADEPVARFYAGGNVPRYTANGVLIWSGAELMDQLAPLAEAGAGDLVQISGQISYAPPVSRAPDYTIAHILEEGGFEFARLIPGKDLPQAVRASYISADRNYSDAELPALAVGAGSTSIDDDGILDLPLPFVTEATQAMRVQKIARNRLAAQKRISCMLPPDAIDLTPGAVVAWGISELPKCNGNWRVGSISPSAWLQGDGVALRCPVQLVEQPANVDAWNPAADEFELATEEYTPPAPVRVPPADLQATTGPGVASGTTARIRFSFLPVAGNVVGYEWQWREVGGSFAEGGSISDSVRDASDRGFGFLVPVEPGVEYQIQVRTIYLGAISDFTSVTITAQGPEFALDPPSDGEAIGGAGQIVVSFRAPNNAAFEGIEFWANDADDITTASLIEGPFFGSANATFEITESGLGADVTRYYWARSVGPFGSVSGFSASVNATTDP